jgi:hypothetical protein
MTDAIIAVAEGEAWDESRTCRHCAASSPCRRHRRRRCRALSDGTPFDQRN